jgi:hypothetical protein
MARTSTRARSLGRQGHRQPLRGRRLARVARPLPGGSARTSGEPHEALAARHVAQRTRASWYRTIDRVYPELTGTPKLLIPDIKGEPMVVLDEGQFYPHHNLYHVTSSTWDLRALATVLRSSIAVLFVSTYCVKMSGGFLRFQAQYLRRIRIPRWDDVRGAARGA